MKCSVCFF